jgi:hypothetical protein
MLRLNLFAIFAADAAFFGPAVVPAHFFMKEFPSCLVLTRRKSGAKGKPSKLFLIFA